MASIKTRDLEAALLRKGFRKDDTHHKYYWFFVGKTKTTVKTLISHGLKEYGNSLLSRVKKELHLDSPQQLVELVECSLSEQDYLKILRGKHLA
jgi:hypothetical protein